MAINLSAQSIEELPEGVSLKTFGNTKLVLFKQGGKLTKACKNKCAHMGGEFVLDVEDVAKQFVKCTYHGWKLDASTMTYPNQLKHFTTCCKRGNADTLQPQFTIEEVEGGGVKLTEGGAGGLNPHIENIEQDGRPICAKLGPCAVEVKPGGGLDFLGGKYAWCTCGHSKNQPWCDGSHRDFPGTKGPLVFAVTEAKTMYLCACKATKTPPNCDGSHCNLLESNLGKPLPK